MDWDNIRIFLAVARAGQFSAAALQLGVDTATVGRRVNALEAALKARLFHRNPAGATLTAAGERFYATAEEVDSQILRAQSDISASEVAVAGTVRIAAPDGFGTLFLCPTLGALKARYPELTVQLVPISRSFSLSKREADVAVTIEKPREGRLAARKLVDYSLHFYASRKYLGEHGAPKDVDDLKRHCVVTYVQDLLFAEQLAFVPELYGPSFSRLECSTAVAQLEAVRSGAGIGILHDYAAHRDPALQVVLPELRFDRTYWLVTHQDTRGLTRVRAAADHVVEAVRARKAVFRVG